jgi:hypothetical protein
MVTYYYCDDENLPIINKIKHPTMKDKKVQDGRSKSWQTKNLPKRATMLRE